MNCIINPGPTRRTPSGRPLAARLNALFRTAACAGTLLAAATTATSATVAYYRFEEGASDAQVVSGVDNIIDSAGANDPLRAFNAAGAPFYRSDVPGAFIPQGGAANIRSLQFDGGDDLFTNLATASGPWVTGVYTSFTIEAWFKSGDLTANRTIVGRDDSGNPGQGTTGTSLFYLQTTNNAGSPRVRFEFVDGSNAKSQITFGTTLISTGTWYHIALVGDNGTARLYLNGVLQGSAPYSGGMFNPSPETIWTVGRGQFNNAVADRFIGWIDEVRVSDTALPPSQWLNYDSTVFSFAAQPSNTSAFVGQSASLSADAGGTPAPTYQWEKSTDGGTVWTPVPGATSATYTIPSAAYSDNGQFRVIATSGSNTLTSNAVTLTVAYAPPAGLTAVVGNAQVALSWTASAGAADYTVRRSSSYYGPFTDLVTQAGTTYTDLTPVNGTLYYYTVAANNAGVSSANATPVAARPQSFTYTGLSFNIKGAAQTGMAVADLAGAPSVRLPNWNNLSIPATTNGLVNLTALVDSSGAAVSGVTVTYTNGTSSNVTTTGVIGANDRNLFFSAADIFGDSPTNTGNNPATISVTGIPYASYEVYFYIRGDGPNRASAFTVNGTTYYVRGGLANPGDTVADGSGYVHSETTNPGPQPDPNGTPTASTIPIGNYVRVTGLSGNLTVSAAAYYAGDAFPRNKFSGFQIVSATAVPPPSSAPATPSGLAITPGVAQNVIAWSASNGATGYTLQRATAAAGPYSTIATPTAYVGSYTDTGLTEGATYYYIISASNSFGASADSAPVSGTTLPAPPAGLTALGGNGQVTLTWTPSTIATGHTIKRSTTAGGPYDTIATSGAAGTYTDTGLTNGTGYYYVVVTNSPAGFSADSAETLGVPVLPSVVRAIGVNFTNNLANGSVASALSGAPGVRRGNWNNYIGAVAATSSTNPAVLISPVAGALVDDTGVTVTGMEVQFAGVNGSIGAGVTTEPERIYAARWDHQGGAASSVLISGIPYATFDLYVYVLNDGDVRGGYVEDTQTGLLYYIRTGIPNPGAGGTGYVLAADTSLGAGTDVKQGNYIHIPGCVPVAAGNNGYALNLRAVNVGSNTMRLKFGAIQLVNTSTSTTLPAAATNVVATAGNAQVGLTWTAAPGVSTYNIRRGTVAGGGKDTIVTGVTGTSYTDTTVANGTTYTYVVTSVSATAGTDSAEASASPSLPAPTGLSAIAGDASVALSWTASAGATTYTIKQATVAGGPYTTISSGTVSGTSYTATGLSNGTTYYYVVSAVGTGGESGNSNEASATPASALTALQSWRVTHFGSSANSGNGADAADPDQDGRANLLEYATGTNPNTNDPGTAVALVNSGGFLTLTFNHIGDPTLTYVVEAANEVSGSWGNVQTYTGLSSAGTTTYTDSVALGGIARRFLRLRVTAP